MTKKVVLVLECLDKIANEIADVTTGGISDKTTDRGMSGESFRRKFNNILLYGSLILVEMLHKLLL